MEEQKEDKINVINAIRGWVFIIVIAVLVFFIIKSILGNF